MGLLQRYVNILKIFYMIYAIVNINLIYTY